VFVNLVYVNMLIAQMGESYGKYSGGCRSEVGRVGGEEKEEEGHDDEDRHDDDRMTLKGDPS
jgi:hypothetical protein